MDGACHRLFHVPANPGQSSAGGVRAFTRIPRNSAEKKDRRHPLTGSGGKTIAALFDADFEDDIRTLVRCIRVFYPQVRTVFEMGWETSKYVLLSKDMAARATLEFWTTNSAPIALQGLVLLLISRPPACSTTLRKSVRQRAMPVARPAWQADVQCLPRPT